ncbi:Fic family protein [Neolewinella antarctica]|uniref:Fic family protein/predicted XRE-type DNA-binding protein n=1 Tax=Neolewinella antarctica TaxID=442734 RepID=A0ABX0XDA3_9BACT|nr:Fic family protein [Neolewinella antarctica]NJC27293.1 Fic family protein/predicted XRE-type DNA-binding protein [Neolewinella antarctica]
MSPTFQDHSRNEYSLSLHKALMDEIRCYLEYEGVSQSQFARQIGVSKSYVSQMLNGKSDLKLSTLVNLAYQVGKVPHLIFSDRPLQPYSIDEVEEVLVVNDPGKGYGKNSILDKVNWQAVTSLRELQQYTSMKAEVDALRPFDKRMEAHVLQQYLRIWNYNSNAIEGNHLTYGETEALLLHGITAKGKPLKDHLDILGHRDAVELMLAMIKGDRRITQADIRELHKIMLKENYQQNARRPDGQRVFRTIHVGVYKREPNHVVTADGDKHYYAEPSAVPGLMAELLDWYHLAADEGKVHPLILATIFHHEFVAIHPFDDGNGRIGRILMNFILMRAGYPLAVIPVSNRDEYYRSLMAADDGDYLALTQFIGKRLYSALDIQLTTARGEDIGGSRWET